MKVNRPYAEPDKRCPGEFPQVHYAGQPHYDSKHVPWPMANPAY